MDILVSEVGPRDGLQSVKSIMPTAGKHRWIAAMAQAGLREIEVGSFVSPRAAAPAAGGGRGGGRLVRVAARAAPDGGLRAGGGAGAHDRGSAGGRAGAEFQICGAGVRG